MKWRQTRVSGALYWPFRLIIYLHGQCSGIFFIYIILIIINIQFKHVVFHCLVSLYKLKQFTRKQKVDKMLKLSYKGLEVLLRRNQ